jgi:hypothetical protein
MNGDGFASRGLFQLHLRASSRLQTNRRFNVKIADTAHLVTTAPGTIDAIAETVANVLIVGVGVTDGIADARGHPDAPIAMAERETLIPTHRVAATEIVNVRIDMEVEVEAEAEVEGPVTETAGAGTGNGIAVAAAVGETDETMVGLLDAIGICSTTGVATEETEVGIEHPTVVEIETRISSHRIVAEARVRHRRNESRPPISPTSSQSWSESGV